MFQNYANLLASLWLEQAVDNEVEIDILRDLTRLTLDITCKGIFDFECNSLTNQGSDVSESFRRIITGSELS